MKSVVESYIKEKNFWFAYKAVIIGACHCIWSNSAFVIEQLMHKAASESTFHWLKAFAALCAFQESLQNECNLKAIQLTKDAPESEIKLLCNISANFDQAIARALASAKTAETSLAAALKLERRFEFQRQLLSLRVGFIRTAGKLLDMLTPICAKTLDGEVLASSDSSTQNDSTTGLDSSMQVIASKSPMICKRFKKLAFGFDLLRMSTMGIDQGSAKLLSLASLGCSFFSFCVLCALLILQGLANGKDLNRLMQSLAASIANDLHLRLCTPGGQECPELGNFVLEHGGSQGSPIISRGYLGAYDVKQIHLFAVGVVKQFLCLKETSIKNPELSRVNVAEGVHLCRDALEKWLTIPWALPRSFLNTRAPVAMDVFMELMIDASAVEMRQITQGTLASLSMCFQIRNLDVNNQLGVRRICSALRWKSCKRRTEDLNGSGKSGCWSGRMVCDEKDLDLLDRLLKQVSVKDVMWEELEKDERKGMDGRGFPPIVLCDVNEKGQGFASCVCDTRSLQCGEYCISVLGVCLDKNRRCWIVPSLRDGPIMSISPPRLVSR